MIVRVSEIASDSVFHWKWDWCFSYTVTARTTVSVRGCRCRLQSCALPKAPHQRISALLSRCFSITPYSLLSIVPPTYPNFHLFYYLPPARLLSLEIFPTPLPNKHSAAVEEKLIDRTPSTSEARADEGNFVRFVQLRGGNLTVSATFVENRFAS